MRDHILDFGNGDKLAFYVWSYGGNKGAEAQVLLTKSITTGHHCISSLSSLCEFEGEKISIDISQRMSGLDPKQLRALAKWANDAAKNIEVQIRDGNKRYP